MSAFRNTIRWLTQPAIVYYSLPALMILLTAGTLAQAELGLYAAHQKYFGSFIVWAGPHEYLQFPLPGGYLLIGLLSLNLLLKFIFYSEWSWRKSGIILAHLGALTLLIGGLLTALLAREGYMVIEEGRASPFVYDYHKRELAVFRDQQPLTAFDFDALTPGQTVRDNAIPFSLTILNSCRNCEILKRAETEQDFVDMDVRALAQFMALERKDEEKENEANLGGVTFNLTGVAADVDGSYIAFEAMPRPITFETGGHSYTILFGKAQRRLPFSLELHDFKKEDYPGGMMSRAYSSEVSVVDDGARWKALIEMNKPLRYKGYTFYQSSFDQSGALERTILSVVENKGRVFPYIGTVIIALGLILHLLLSLRKDKSA